MADPIRVAVTGAAGQIAYSLVYQLAKGDVFGQNQPIILHLLDIPPMMGVLEGVVMEIADLALPLVQEVIPTADLSVAFKDVQAVFMLGSMPRKQGMERRDLLTANVKIFKEQGQALNKYANKDVKVLVVGNPANTNALVCSKYAPDIPKENFSALTRLDQNRATAAVAAKIGVGVDKVKNVIVWGNHSSTQYPDVSNAVVSKGAEPTPVRSLINDTKWIQEEFVKTIQTRGAAVINARKMSSAMSASKAAADHMKDLWFGTRGGEYVSMAVISDGSYGIPKDIMYSFPVATENKKWKIVQGLSVDDFSRSMMDKTAQELIEECTEALQLCKDD